MEKKRSPSLGDLLDQSPKTLFFGQEAQPNPFDPTLKLGSAARDFFPLFNIYGQGGVRKTKLAEKFPKKGKAAGCAM